MRSPVFLTHAEVELAALIGIKRFLSARKLGRMHRYGAEGKLDFWLDIQGAIGEAAVAKHSNQYWLPDDTEVDLKAIPGDVGRRQVRCRPLGRDRLLLHPDDPDEAAFVLALGPAWTKTGAELELVGWVWGHEGKNPKFWGDPFKTRLPAFWVPLEELRPMRSLVFAPLTDPLVPA
jgi:hypothetical protein